MPAVEVMLNTKLISELIEQRRLQRRQGSDGEVARRRLADLRAGPRAPDHRGHVITRDEGLAYADSPTNLMWRLQNDMTPVSRERAEEGRERRPAELHRDHARRAPGRSRRRVAEPAPLLSDARPDDRADVGARLHLAEQLIALPLGHARRRRLPGAHRRAPRAARLRLHDARRSAPPTARVTQPVGAAPRPRGRRQDCSSSPATPTSCRPGRSPPWTQRPVRADAPRRHALRPRRRRHEELDRGDGRRRRGVRRRAPGARRLRSPC